MGSWDELREYSPDPKYEALASESFRGRNSDPEIDPFLAQYLKPAVNDRHVLYFRSLEKHTKVKSYDFYSQYFNRSSRPEGPDGQTLNDVNKHRNRIESPLRRRLPSEFFEPTSLSEDEDEDEDEDEEDEEDLLKGQRRRKSTSELFSAGPTSKKLHPQVYTTRLPKEFMKCSIDDLINLIYRMLQSLINLNDKSVPLVVSHPGHPDEAELPAEEKKKLLTRFHSRTPPAISIQTYLARLTKFNNFTQATLLTTIYYIDLLSHNYQPYFTLNSWTVHRFLLVATMLAQKSLEDFFYTNDHYAKVGGVALTELNCLELDFLTRVNWKLVPAKQMDDNTTSIRYSKQVLDLYYEQLINLMGGNVSEQNYVVYKLETAEHI